MSIIDSNDVIINKVISICKAFTLVRVELGRWAEGSLEWVGLGRHLSGAIFRLLWPKITQII